MRLLFRSLTVSLLFFSGSVFGESSARLYFWTNADRFPKLHLSSRLKVSDPKALGLLAQADLSKWFLASPSPVTLRQQGGNDDSWVLIELTVRPEFKTIDATAEFLASLGCPMLTVKSAPLPPECLKSLNAIITTQKVDGLKLSGGGVILTNGKFFHPEDVRIFNRLSIDAAQDRLKIQSLFYRADFEHFKGGLSDSLFPSEINRLNPPFSGGGRGLLWDDLDGKPLDLGH